METNQIQYGIVSRYRDRVAWWSLFFWMGVYLLAVLQDLLFSRLNHTGFYWSESLLYNTYWFLFVPLLPFLKWIAAKTGRYPLPGMIGGSVLAGLLCSLAHILTFTASFILISTVLYDTPHRFIRILNSVLSHQFYVTIVAYTGYILFHNRTLLIPASGKRVGDIRYRDILQVRQGRHRMKVPVEAITAITTDKPYIVIHNDGHKLLHDCSLKQLGQYLDPSVLIRVHRSAIVHRDHIVRLTSRGNGDYDATLSDGLKIRFSRHYRQNWEQLIPSTWPE